MPTQRVIAGDMRSVLATLPEKSVHLCVTSPPYFGLRSYGVPDGIWGGDDLCEHVWAEDRVGISGGGYSDKSTLAGFTNAATKGRRMNKEAKALPAAFCLRCNAWRGCLGAEPSVALYVAHLIECFHAVKRVLRDDGTCWVVLGDSYSGGGGWSPDSPSNRARREKGNHDTGAFGFRTVEYDRQPTGKPNGHPRDPGLKPKDLCLVPERFRIAAQDDGWTVRSVIRWCKRSCMPESCEDRPTSAVEDIVVLAKSARYFYDAEAVKTPPAASVVERAAYTNGGTKLALNGDRKDGDKGQRTHFADYLGGANMRNFWLLGPEPLADDHFAAYPTEIPRRAILAGTSARGCCPACGAGWRRVVEREASPNGDRQRGRGKSLAESGLMPGKENGGYDNHGASLALYETRTVGWSPSCRCDAGDPVPAVVLDPFLGSGRTLIAADRLGRDGIGVELSRYHAGKAKARIFNDCPLFASVAD